MEKEMDKHKINEIGEEKGRVYSKSGFQIHITGDDLRQNARVRAFPRIEVEKKVRKSKTTKSLIHSVQIAIHESTNPFMEKLRSDDDVYQEIIDEDNEVDFNIMGKNIKRTTTLLLKLDNELCYNYTEYEQKMSRGGKLIPCKICGEIYCEHNIKNQTEANSNIDDSPLRWIKPMEIKKVDAIKKWSFDKSYQIRHIDGITFKFLYNMAKKLNDSNKLVMLAGIKDGKPQKTVLKNHGKEVLMFLEGRVSGDNAYALILHRTTLKIGE